MSLAAGTMLGPYKIVSLIGAGGMGEVYRAEDTRLRRSVAIKILPTSFSSDPDRLRRFEQEARTLAALNHPNVVVVHDFGSQDGITYLVSELLEGQTLRELLLEGKSGLRSTVEYAIQIAQGLAAAHGKGIIHRDLKPENLFLTNDGRMKILDFGLAKAQAPAAAAVFGNTITAAQTQPGLILGTLGYMAPEQLRSEMVDQRCDIFSLGAVIYEMLSSQRAFKGRTSAEVMSSILKEEPPPLSESPFNVSPALDRIVQRCLNKNPEWRFQSAADIAFALEGITASNPALPAIAESVWRPRLLLLVMVVMIAGLATIAWLAWSTRVPQRSFRYRQVTFRRGSIQSARFESNGVGILYSAQWEGDPPQIQSTRIGDVEYRPLGLPEGTIAAVSPQGGIAMLLGCEPFFVSDCGGTLAQLPPGGGAPRALLEHVHSADWSPSGDNLAVVVQDPNGHNRLEYPIGHVVYETAGWITSPRVSPDGKLVAFAVHDVTNDDRGSVSVVDSEGKVRSLTQELASVEGLAWSASGRDIWFAASTFNDSSAWSGTLFTVNLEGRIHPVIQLPGIIRLHDVSPDGRLLVSREVWRKQLVGFFPGDNAEHPYAWFDWSVSMGSGLSKDGRQLLFTEAGAAATDAFIPYLRRTDGSAAVRLGKGAAIALSPDGKWAAVNDLILNKLSLVPTGPGRVRQMDPGAIEYYDFPGWWSADGKVLTFVGRERGRGMCVYSQDVFGGSPRKRTTEMQFTGMLRPHFAVSSDASLVAVTPAGASSIHLFDNSGKDIGEVRGTSENDVPAAFSEDGRLIVGLRNGSWPLQFFLVDPKSGKRELWKRFTPLDRAGLRADWDLSVTPDLRYYTYSFTQATSELYLVGPQSQSR